MSFLTNIRAPPPLSTTRNPGKNRQTYTAQYIFRPYSSHMMHMCECVWVCVCSMACCLKGLWKQMDSHADCRGFINSGCLFWLCCCFWSASLHNHFSIKTLTYVFLCVCEWVYRYLFIIKRCKLDWMVDIFISSCHIKWCLEFKYFRFKQSLFCLWDIFYAC